MHLLAIQKLVAMRARTLFPAIVVSLFTALPAATGHPNYVGTPNPIIPAPGAGIPTPDQVTGKEYTDMPNKNDNHLVASRQNLAWDGIGGVVNSILYPTLAGYIATSNRVDALANHGDLFFWEVAFLNTAALLVSVTGDSPGANGTAIWSESIFGATAPWATKLQIDHGGVIDLDGLEVWGPDGPNGDDSDRFSIFGDPNGWSVYHYNLLTGVVTPYISQAFIGAAIGLPTDFWHELDLDSLMAWDDGDTIFGPDDWILFSIRPLPGFFDGGEIWTLNGLGVAAFLNHGGHIWDTAFDVMGTFGVNNENIDALEAVAVPEPGTWAMLVLGSVALLIARRRKAQS
jgi:hypothetical protein